MMLEESFGQGIIILYGYAGCRTAWRGIRDKAAYGYLAAHRHEIFRDDDFAMLYCENNGRGCVPPSLLATALLLQWHDGTSDEETVNRVKYDLRWKVALGLKMEEVPFVKSTLWLFRTQLIVRGEALKIFKEPLKHARDNGYFPKGIPSEQVS